MHDPEIILSAASNAARSLRSLGAVFGLDVEEMRSIAVESIMQKLRTITPAQMALSDCGGLYYRLGRQGIFREVQKLSTEKRRAENITSLDVLLENNGERFLVSEDADPAEISGRRDLVSKLKQHVKRIPGMRGRIVRAVLADGSITVTARRLGMTRQAVENHCARARQAWHGQRAAAEAEEYRAEFLETVPHDIKTAVLAISEHGTQAAAAQALGVSPGTIHMKLRGARYLWKKYQQEAA